MSQKNIDYSCTVIYKITCKDPAVTDLYVGHTTDFVKRRAAHKRECLQSDCKLYKTIRDNGGWTNWSMEALTFFNCQDLIAAKTKEQEYFVALKATLNSVEPLGNKKIKEEGDGKEKKNKVKKEKIIEPMVIEPTVIHPKSNIKYRLTATSVIAGILACSAFSEVSITVPFTVPNVFTPNGDGVEDTFEIGGINNYPQAAVSIFDRRGKLLYSSIGYQNPWDGAFHGIGLPVATYYYEIDLGNGAKSVGGYVYLMR